MHHVEQLPELPLEILEQNSDGTIQVDDSRVDLVHLFFAKCTPVAPELRLCYF